MHIHPQHPAGGARTRGAFRRVLAGVAIAAAAIVAVASPAAAHDQLIDTAILSADSGEVNAVRLSYNNAVLTVGAEIHVTDAQGTGVAHGDPQISGRDVTQALTPPLADGRYDAVWRVVSSDGHPIEGGFSFEITDGAPGEVLPLSEEFSPGGAAPAPSATDGADRGAPDASGIPVAVWIVGAALIAGALIAWPIIARTRTHSAAAGRTTRAAASTQTEQE